MRAILAALVLLPAGAAAQAVPPEITYQGRLLQSGAPVNGTRQVQLDFCMTSGGTGCTPTASQPVSVQNGLFRTTVTAPAGALASGANWLRVRVDGSFLTPLERLTSSPYALFAGSAAAVSAANFVGFSVDGVERARLDATGLGIGIAAPEARLHVRSTTAQSTFVFEGTGGSADPRLWVRARSGGGHAGISLDRADTGAHAYVNWQDNNTHLWALRTPDFLSDDPNQLDLVRYIGGEQVIATFRQSGNVGLGIQIPTHRLDVNGGIIGRSSFTLAGIGAPPVAPAGRGAIYFDSSTGRFRVSESGSAYRDLSPVASSTSYFAANGSIPADAEIVFADASGGNITLTLPAASAATVGRTYRIVKADNGPNTVTLVPAGGDTIVGLTALGTAGRRVDVIGLTAASWVGAD